MTTEKAKEFFSAYHDGELEKGLKEALERKLAADAALRAEYDAFCLTMGSLSLLAEPVKEPEFDLHERIMARIDKAQWEAKRSKPAGFLQWWKSLAVGGLAVAAILTAITQLNSGSVGPTPAGVLGSAAPGQLSLKQDDKGLTLVYQSAGSKRVILRNYGGEVLEQRVVANKDTLTSALTNKRDETLLLEIDVEGSQPTFVAIPGQKPSVTLQGQGTLKDFAIAFADHFRVPLALEHVDLTQSVAWKFDSTDAFQSLSKHLSKQIEKRNGVMWVSGN
ncbi:MAG: hypothetical protein HZC36_12290 [Armatimonadetes bacterium]|nr:hypothetical protein [Armatimonadota bacterium]